MFDIKEQLKKLPELPGVYLMKDEKGNIIYVGKSKALNKRVSSYFKSLNSHAPKVRAMVANIVEFEYIITNTEMEALILEQTLIKKYKPKFNILLRDDKQYPYIKITRNEEFPRVFMTRSIIRDKALYFGPYTNVDAVKKTLDIIHSVYPIRKCSKSLKNKNERPCLNYHIGLCLGPCNGKVLQNEYLGYIDQIIEILNGKQEKLVEYVTLKMKVEAENLNFEKAALYRDYLNALGAINEKQTVIYPEVVDIDGIGIYSTKDRTCFTIFFVRGGKLIGRDNFVVENEGGIISSEIIYNFVSQYYSGNTVLPKEILISHEFDEADLISRWLSDKYSKKVAITTPKRGDKKRLVDLVVDNAREYMDKFSEKIDYEISLSNYLNGELKAVLDMDRDIIRIEAFDISNIAGVHQVGTMVVFENWKRKSSDYRKFKINMVEGPDDYKSMEEVLNRRFKRGIEERSRLYDSEIDSKFSVFPDLILMDGGKAHVDLCLRILEELGLDIPVAGMAKDDRHRTERLYLPKRNGYFQLKSNRELFKFITSVQDEVHRFSIEYHRQLRSKSLTDSVLDEIEGIGDKRKKELIKKFGSIETIKNATIEELKGVSGMNSLSAKKVYDFFLRSR